MYIYIPVFTLALSITVVFIGSGVIYLVVFDSEVMPTPLQMTNLHTNKTEDTTKTVRLSTVVYARQCGRPKECHSDTCASFKTLPSPHLTEEAGNESLPDVDVVVTTGELRTGTTKTEPVHDPGQLVSNTVA